MSTVLTELVSQLQDFGTHYPNEARVMVAVPTSPHAMENFEVETVDHEGPSVVLHCRPLPEEEVRPREGENRSREETVRPHLHNDYEDLC
jgi:hypothetical protein